MPPFAGHDGLPVARMTRPRTMGAEDHPAPVVNVRSLVDEAEKEAGALDRA
ncbi:hypothetical protein [Streptomyces sp. NPDC046759]|uniref:hypothetical protein n=1 Tax=Streptomyces sp. NPDC046759 TaxID=3155019 RepID=UPI0033CA2BB3